MSRGATGDLSELWREIQREARFRGRRAGRTPGRGGEEEGAFEGDQACVPLELNVVYVFWPALILTGSGCEASPMPVLKSRWVQDAPVSQPPWFD